MTDTTARMTKVIDVYAVVAGPFTHLGLRWLTSYREEVGRLDVALKVHAWPLELVNGEPLSRDLLTKEVAALRAQVASDAFAGFDPTMFPMTSMPALALAARAYRADVTRGEHVNLALRDALFEQGRDISDPAAIAAIGDAFDVGLPDEADMAAVLADLAEGRARGVIGSPHYFVNGAGFFCPSLEIRHADGDLQIEVDRSGFERFVDHCFELDVP